VPISRVEHVTGAGDQESDGWDGMGWNARQEKDGPVLFFFPSSTTEMHPALPRTREPQKQQAPNTNPFPAKPFLPSRLKSDPPPDPPQQARNLRPLRRRKRQDAIEEGGGMTSCAHDADESPRSFYPFRRSAALSRFPFLSVFPSPSPSHHHCPPDDALGFSRD
jgi:hypothetical protein